ncbi:MAG: NAD(P)H-hydrate epimerase [Eggerthellales bacterium]|nr:NAD(P)H-hydrate epimerase [Eggerthellales bacterium]
MDASTANALTQTQTTTTPLVASVEEVKQIELLLEQEGTSLYSLMGKAGGALADAVMDHLRNNSSTNAPKIAVLCATGNNGGDGWVAAGILARFGMQVDLFSSAGAGDLKAQPAALWAQEVCAGAQSTLRIHVGPEGPWALSESAEGDEAYDVVIDCMLGTGFAGVKVKNPFDRWVNWCNQARHQGSWILAADVPSGLNAQTGKVAVPCVKAHRTVTMITSKPGLETPYAFAYCGEVTVAEIADPRRHLAAIRSQCNCAPRTKDGACCAVVPSFISPQTRGPERMQPEFYRAETEDDDGYDPYSDRRPEPEPLFTRNPWD